ncbi:MAG TPA: energy transducer TonB [Novosphingobium sp.]|nr:energy transducer TonB [Novosphingobium sp.]
MSSRIMQPKALAALGLAVALAAPALAQKETYPPAPLPADTYPPPPTAVLSRPPVPTGNPGVWVQQSDYPPAALREEREGNTGFRLYVDATGRPTACTVTSSSGSPDLDETACEMMMLRARFKPARDSKGLPTAGTFASRVRWVLPRDPEAYAPGERVLTFYIQPDGLVTNCQETLNGEIVVPGQSGIRSPCIGGLRMTPPVDAAGKPVRKKVVIRQTLTITDAE